MFLRMHHSDKLDPIREKLSLTVGLQVVLLLKLELHAANNRSFSPRAKSANFRMDFGSSRALVFCLLQEYIDDSFQVQC